VQKGPVLFLSGRGQDRQDAVGDNAETVKDFYPQIARIVADLKSLLAVFASVAKQSRS
jgi:malate/lactate dehydrogenase